jgi:ankyrin repeat protein
MARLLLEYGARVDEADDAGTTPLLRAAAAGHNELVGLLLRSGAAVDLASKSTGMTALYAAAYNCDAATVQTLLEGGAHALIRASTNGMTALHVAADQREGCACLAVLELLLARNVNVNAPLGNGYARRTALHLAASTGNSCSPAVMRLLVAHGAHVDALDSNGATPLTLAAQSGSLRAVAVLLELGAACDVVDKYHATPLDLAIRSHHSRVVLLLAQHVAPSLADVPGAAKHFDDCFGKARQCAWLSEQQRARPPWVRALENLSADPSSLGARLKTSRSSSAGGGRSSSGVPLLLPPTESYANLAQESGVVPSELYTPHAVCAVLLGGVLLAVGISLRTLVSDTWAWFLDTAAEADALRQQRATAPPEPPTQPARAAAVAFRGAAPRRRRAALGAGAHDEVAPLDEAHVPLLAAQQVAAAAQHDTDDEAPGTHTHDAADGDRPSEPAALPLLLPPQSAALAAQPAAVAPDEAGAPPAAVVVLVRAADPREQAEHARGSAAGAAACMSVHGEVCASCGVYAAGGARCLAG